MGIIKGRFRFVAGWGTDLLLNVPDRGIRVLFPSIIRFSLSTNIQYTGVGHGTYLQIGHVNTICFCFFECLKFEIVR